MPWQRRNTIGIATRRRRSSIRHRPNPDQSTDASSPENTSRKNMEGKMRIDRVTRRTFLGAMAATAVAYPIEPALSAAKYRRCNVTSAEGQKALGSYAKGVEAMLKLPADHPHNWFR